MTYVKRSPAKVAWHVMCNGVVVAVAASKRAAEAISTELNTKYGAMP